MSLNFTTLEAEAKTWIANEYNNVIKPFVQKEYAAFKPLIQATETELVQQGLPIVLSLMGAAIGGPAKMAAAIPALISAVGAIGKTVAATDAQAALQIVVAQVKDAATAMEAAIPSQ